jgi:hypothetical protein
MLAGLLIISLGDSNDSESLSFFGGNVLASSYIPMGLMLWIEEPLPVDKKSRLFIGVMVFLIMLGFFIVALGLYPTNSQFWGVGSMAVFAGTGMILISSAFLKDHLLGLKIIYRFGHLEKIDINKDKSDQS